MATKYVTLKDSNGDTLYPQAVATNLAPGSIDTTELADGAVTTAKIAGSAVTTAKINSKAVTSAKIADGVLEYKAGDTITFNSGDYHYFAGRTRTSGSNKQIWFFVQLDKPVQSGRSITFTPSGYQEVFGPSGTIISVNNPSTSVMTFTVWVSSQSRSCVQMQMNILDGTSLTGNLCCSVHIGGVFTIS